MISIDINQDIEKVSCEVSRGMIVAAGVAIPKTKPKTLNRIVPWWSKECKEVIKDRNRAFKKFLKNTFSEFNSM